VNCRRQAERHRNGEINREDYDKWRYNYPKYDETSGYVKVPSQQLSDALVEAFKDRGAVKIYAQNCLQAPAE
jgi:hypothetical protein